MSEFNYFEEKKRMIKGLGGLDGDTTCGGVCIKCPLSNCKNGYELGCTIFEMYHPHEAEAIVRKWAEEHPRKTRKDVLLEKFPNAILNDNGCPAACAKDLGLRQGYCLDNWCVDCWNTEVEE